MPSKQPRTGSRGPAAAAERPQGSPASLGNVPEPRFLFRDMLEEGEVALLGSEGIDAVNELAHHLGQTTIALVRNEPGEALQEETVMSHADSLPLVWVAGSFSDRVLRWAHDRGPMTLLSESTGALNEDERRRIDRFVAILGRQSE